MSAKQPASPFDSDFFDCAVPLTYAPPTSSETSYVGDVLLTNNLVYLSTNTTIYAIDTTTHQSVWSMPTSGYLALSEYGVLYVVETVSGSASTTGNVYAVNVK